MVGSALVGGLTAWVGEGETGVGTNVGLAGVDGWVAVGVGVTISGDAELASDTTKEVPAMLPKYDSEPSKVAFTVYSPGTGGVHAMA